MGGVRGIEVLVVSRGIGQKLAWWGEGEAVYHLGSPYTQALPSVEAHGALYRPLPCVLHKIKHLFAFVLLVVRPQMGHEVVLTDYICEHHL
jgi:hypothetical protein